MTKLHHLSISTAHLDEAARFYDAVLGELGYEKHFTSERLCTWVGDGPEILLWPVEGPDSAPHTFGRPGWHHAAFAVEDQETVLAVHRKVLEGGWTVVHEPRSYPDYSEGYFAVFFEDPDGLRLEVAHIPAEGAGDQAPAPSDGVVQPS